jgi:hypothetical protein
VRVEHYASYLERTVFSRIGAMTPKIIDRHMQDDQKAAILGPERAAELRSIDPDMIPGGYRIAFTGSDRVRNKNDRFARVQQALNMVGQQLGPYGMQLMTKEILKWTDAITPDNIDRILAEMQQMAQQPAQTMQAAGQTMSPVPPNAANTATMQAFSQQGQAA